MNASYEIVEARIALGPAGYPRPVVVLYIQVDAHRVLPISSKLDLYRADQHFLIRDDHPDFPATGLRVTSYIVGSTVIDVPSSDVIRKLGALTGGLADEFARWID